ncbi:MAG: hypothetical protein IJ068_02740 [Bacilli bacterium]|nr:hypothetical protein [Bacilli bacterium]
MVNINSSRYKMPPVKNWKIGDAFALQISSNEHEKYDGRFLIFIFDGYNSMDKSKTLPIFRIKITQKNAIPITSEDIEKLPYVISLVTLLLV